MKSRIISLVLILGACAPQQQVPIRSITNPGVEPARPAFDASEFEGTSPEVAAQLANAQNIVVREAQGAGAAFGQVGTYKIGNPYLIDGVPYYPHEDYNYVEDGMASWYGLDFHGKNTSNGEIFDMDAFTAAHRTLPMPSLVRVTNLDTGASLNLKINDRGPFARDRIIDVSSAAAGVLGMKEEGTARVRVEILPEQSLHLKNLAMRGENTDNVFQPDVRNATLIPGMRERVEVSPAPRAPEPEPEPAPAPVRVPPRPIAVVPAPEPMPAPAPAPMPAPVEDISAATGNFYVQVGAYSSFDRAEAMKNRITDLGQVKIFKAVQGGQTFYKVRLGEFATQSDAERTRSRVDAKGISGSRVILRDGNELRWNIK
ncbi:MAG: septal ring lytic transglycosylase RlpA family protein [Alphaproteobacteria bacterium]|nr:septal ring lytic transglycosylase RlpA family protein [Alphaproteobacteria bacterium]